jgi:hypothetical protein
MPKTPVPVVKTRKQRAPMSEEAKAIMTAKRRATIAAKKGTPILETVVESLLDDKEAEIAKDTVQVKDPEYIPALYSEPIELERQRVFGLLIDIEDFGYAGNLTPSQWLITQAGLNKAQALSYVEEYSNNRQRLKKQYETKPINLNDLGQLSERLSEFYKACPHYIAY